MLALAEIGQVFYFFALSKFTRRHSEPSLMSLVREEMLHIQYHMRSTILFVVVSSKRTAFVQPMVKLNFFGLLPSVSGLPFFDVLLDIPTCLATLEWSVSRIPLKQIFTSVGEPFVEWQAYHS